MTSRTLAKHIAELMLSKKANDVVMLDLRKLTSVTDYFVVCSAESDTQVKAIADAVQEGLEQRGETCYHREGISALQWVVLDYVDVVAHIFYHEARSFYNLERLWADAKRTTVTDALEKTGKSSRKRKKETSVEL